MKILDYPFDGHLIIKKKKSIKRELLENGTNFVEKRIAVLGGSTTHDIIAMMDLFLLNQGIRAEFYECEYAQYFEDVMFDNPELLAFKPDIIYFHTSNRNIRNYHKVQMDEKDVDALLEEKILAVPGSGFGRAGYIRLSCAVDEKIIARSAEGFKRATERCLK